MSQKQLYYRESQKFSLKGLLFIGAVGLPLAMLIGVLHSLAVYWIPLIILHVLFVYASGYSLGIITSLLTALGSVRNTFLNVFTGFTLGLCAVYTYWVSWLYFASQRQLLILDPYKMWAFLNILAEQGGQSIQRRGRNIDIPGELSYMAWLGEAVILIGMSVYFGFKPTRARAFCEACQQWMSPVEELLPLKPAGDHHSFKSQLEQGDWNTYLALDRLEAEDIAGTVAHGLHCEGCDAHLFTVQSVFFSQDKKGNDKQRLKTIVNRLKITPEQWAAIKDHHSTHLLSSEPAADIA